MGGAELDCDSFVIILILDNMDPRAYGKFVAQYKEKYPKATEDEIYEEYLKTQQGKQAMNTRLLGG